MRLPLLIYSVIETAVVCFSGNGKCVENVREHEIILKFAKNGSFYGRTHSPWF